MNPGYRDNATSYTISMHALFSLPRAVVSSDRHLKTDSVSMACSYGVNNTAGIDLSNSRFGSLVSWTNALHGNVGNILFRDGRVAEIPNSQLHASWGAEIGVDAITPAHVLIP